LAAVNSLYHENDNYVDVVGELLAGYSTFAEAYENDEEDQMFTPQGVTKVVRVDDGDFERKAFVADIGGRFLSRVRGQVP
jgi:hypothetical protein